MIDFALVEKLAHLSRLGLSKEEIEKFAGQLDGILEFFTDLQNVETEGIKPVSQITGLTNTTRDDEVQNSEIEAELLKCTKNEISDDHIVVPKAL